MGDIPAGSEAVVSADPFVVDTPGRGANATRRRWFRILLIGGLATGTAAVLGVAGPMLGYLVLDPLTRHVGILLTMSVALLLVAAIVAPIAPGWPSLVRILVVIGLGLVLAIVALGTAWSFAFGESRHSSPDGRSVVVVSESSAMIDPVWYVTVRQASPVLAHTWELACFNGDAVEDGFASVTWVSATEVELRAESGETFAVAIDPRTSEPSMVVTSGCYD